MDNTLTQTTRQCPYCGEDIQPGAIKCRHCNEWLVNNPPPTPKSPEEQAKEQEKQQEKKQGKKMATGCLIVSLVVPVLIIGMFLLVASGLVPDIKQHRKGIYEEVISCAKDQKEDIFTLLGAMEARELIPEEMRAETERKSLIVRFDQYNKIEYEPGTFWSEARIVNRIYPNGKKVSFGILGIIFPSMEWDDMVLFPEGMDRNSISRERLSSSFTQQEEPATKSHPSANASHQAYHGQIQGNIRCEFDLYFEPANEYGQQEVRGTYSYPSQGGRLIILRGWFNPQTDELDLTEYYDDGRANCSMRVTRTPDGFKGWFIRPNKNDLTLVMTE